MKVSVITTLYNEEGNIAQLLDSLLAQTKKPDEIVIVDGGSTDDTYNIINKYCEKHKFIKCFQEKGNIAHGRNFAIKKANNRIIAQVDGGCVAHKKWLERIVEPFEDSEIGLVAGFYDMVAKTSLQKAVAPFHGITPRKFDPRNFLPSGRSMAFRKSTWKKVGGYSEDLQWAGEDTLFNYKILQSGVEIARVPSAYVYWEVPKTFGLTLKKFYKYALGDAQTGIWWHPGKNLKTHNVKIMSIFLRYFIALVLVFLATFNPFYFFSFVIYASFYTFWAVWKLLEDVHDTKARLLVPFIQISSDFAIMLGFSVGILKLPRK